MKTKIVPILIQNLVPVRDGNSTRISLNAETLVNALLRTVENTDKETAALQAQAFYWLPHLEHCPPALQERVRIRRESYSHLSGQELRGVMNRRLKDMELI